MCVSCSSLPATTTVVTQGVCNCRVNAAWSDSDVACICNPTYYMTLSLNCATCLNFVGALADGSSTKGKCNCDGAKNF